MSAPTPSPFTRAHRKAVETTRDNPAIGFGSCFAAAMALFAWLGMRLDEKTGHSPLWVLVGVGLGLFYGAYEVWKLVRRADKAVPAKGPTGEKDGPGAPHGD